MATPQRIKQLEENLTFQYDLLNEIERKIMVEYGPIERAKLNEQKNQVQAQIQQIEKELTDAKTAPTPAPSVPAKSLSLSELREKLVTKFNDEELRDLCFLELGVDYDSLPAQGKAGKARELIAYMQRRDRLPELISIVTKGE